MSAEKLILFTDLDGTLLDLDSYSYEPAAEALRLVRDRDVPLVFCSAKTRLEQEHYRHRLGIRDPFIVENGSAIFIPKDCFSFLFPYQKTAAGYRVIELGVSYRKIRAALEKVRTETSIDFQGYGDMSVEQVAAATGLDTEAAQRAMAREYDETFLLKCSEQEGKKLETALGREGIHCTHGGRFHHALGPNDKGMAIVLLTELYRKKFGQVRTAGIGDTVNDAPMLAAVDIPFLVQRPGGDWEKLDQPNLRKMPAVGPAGWSLAVRELLGS